MPISNPTKKITPQIYAYTTPQIAEHHGWSKIGYTERTARERIKEQLKTADVKWELLWEELAFYTETHKPFKDKDFHRYLRKKGIKQKDKNEWFHIDGENSLELFYQFQETEGEIKSTQILPYTLRDSQQQAVEETLAYYQENADTASADSPEFLWNAKPRFGKTLAVYDFCKKAYAKKVLILTHYPMIAMSWYDDYAKFIGTDHYCFISRVDALKNEARCPLVCQEQKGHAGRMQFVSLQDLKGDNRAGGNEGRKKHLDPVFNLDWDIVVIDEAHQAVDTQKTRTLLGQIKRRFMLHLSGTPFKALASNKFAKDAIYNWTYVDEQEAKEKSLADGEESNPYADMPTLKLFTYKMGEMVEEKAQEGIQINEEDNAYAFDLNEFFKTKTNKAFVYDDKVDHFLNTLTSAEKFPFSTETLRRYIKHSFWYLDRVDSVKALKKKLEAHPIFRHYHIVDVAGNQSTDDEEKNALEKVRKAIQAVEKGESDKIGTLTLSAGRLTTGITVPEWTAVLMLANMASPALYMQTAFRAQNPWGYRKNGDWFQKTHAYVFDFDPSRSLKVYEEFANNLSVGEKDHHEREKNIRQLLNFFPVIGEDEEGKMVELNAKDVLILPNKIKAQDVVKRGFISNLLFNIGNVFGASQEVIAILNKMPVAPKSPLRTKKPLILPSREALHLNEAGEVEIPQETIVGKYAHLFGDKIYKTEIKAPEIATDHNTDLDKWRKEIEKEAKNGLNAMEKLAEEEVSLTGQEKNRLRKLAEQEISHLTHIEARSLANKIADIEQDYQQKIAETEASYHKDLEAEQEKAIALASQLSQQTLSQKIDDELIKHAENLLKKAEENQLNKEKDEGEEDARARLRNFSRTIPASLMAYGNERHDINLQNFDRFVPAEVFLDLTSISLDDFRLLRENKMFNEEIFNQAIQEFMHKKDALANYFDESLSEDIFDYIPPQKTNQIFTPKAVVKMMVDKLEQESPNCFNDPNHSFADLYVKSGLYLAEIIRRLYQSPALEKAFPNPKARLAHIFAKQIYGLAPSPILYNIVKNYLLGFDKENLIQNHNLKQFDTAQFLQQKGEVKLSEKLTEIFPA